MHATQRRATTLTCALVLAGCGQIGADPPLTAQDLGLPQASTFSCSELDGSESACLDFNDNEPPGFDVEGGEWEPIDGRYVGFGPESTGGECPDSLLTHALVPDVEAQDVNVKLELASIERVDKALVLRSTGERDRIQLNFRARSPEGDYGDFMVQEVRDCVFTKLTTDNQVPLPHAMGEKIDVEVDLVGTALLVRANGEVIFDDNVPVAVQSGQIGFGIIDNATTMFDDVIITSLDDGAP